MLRPVCGHRAWTPRSISWRSHRWRGWSHLNAICGKRRATPIPNFLSRSGKVAGRDEDDDERIFRREEKIFVLNFELRQNARTENFRNAHDDDRTDRTHPPMSCVEKDAMQPLFSMTAFAGAFTCSMPKKSQEHHHCEQLSLSCSE